MEQENSQSEKLEKIINLINNESKEYKSEEIEDIKLFLSNHYQYIRQVFKKVDQAEQERFIKGLKCVFYCQGQLVETQGNCSTRFGIIMKGRVKIKSSNNGKKKQYHENKMILKQGDRIGAESMLLQKPNLYSLCVESESVVLLEINKQQFDKYIRQSESEKFEQSIAILKEAQLFKLISNDSILTMILYNSFKIQFDTGEVVYSQDQNCYAIYIVLQGKFQVQQRFYDDTDQQMNQSITSNGESEDNTTRNNGGNRGSIQSEQSSFINNQTTLKLRVVEPFDIFGEEEIIETKQRGASVICIQDFSQVLVVRPVIYKSCIINDDFVKSKLVEMIGQKQLEVKEKEKQKRDSYQNLGNRSRKSSLTVTPKNQFQMGENKESQFAKLHKSCYNNESQLKYTKSFSDSSNSSLSPSTFRKQFNRKDNEVQSTENQNVNSSKEMDTFGGFVRYQEQIQKESNNASQRILSKQTSLNVRNLMNLQQMQDSGDSDINSESPFEPWSSNIEVYGKKIGETNVMSKLIIDSSSPFKSSFQKISTPKKSDFQVGPYQQNIEEQKKRVNTSQATGRKFKASPLFVNFKSENSPTVNKLSQQCSTQVQNLKKNLFHSLSTCNSPLFTSSPTSCLTNKSLQFQPRQQTQSSNLQSSFHSIFNKVKTPQVMMHRQISEGSTLKSLKSREYSQSQQEESFKIDHKNSNDRILEQTQIFSKQNSLPITSFNQRLRMKSQNQMRQRSSSNSMKPDHNSDNRNLQSSMSGSINRPAIIVPNSIPLQSPISNIYHTQLNLTTLQQLKESNYQNKRFSIEKYAFIGNQKLPSIKQDGISKKTIIRNNSQPNLNKTSQKQNVQYNQIK